MTAESRYLSACLIVGDAHVGCLARCLRSLLVWPQGPAVDEIVIGWNGEKDDEFVAALREVSPDADPSMDDDPKYTYVDLIEQGDREVQLVVHRYTWANDFAAARNDNFNHASGVWRMYVDADDILVGPGHVAYEDSLEMDPPRGTVGTAGTGTKRLSDALKALPPHVNAVWAPYAYLNSGDTGRPVLRKRRPRIMRWEPNWVWVSEVHEVTRHALGREIGVWMPDLVLYHQPVQGETERAERNSPILSAEVERLQAEGTDVPANLLYSQAVLSMSDEDWKSAVDAFKRAADSTGDGGERQYYLLLAARCCIEAGAFEQAASFGMDAVEAAPDRPEGYYAIAEAAFRVQQFDSCLKWYEVGKTRKVSGPVMVDDRLERCLRPVRFAAIAYLRFFRYDEALAVAEEALKYVEDAMALRIAEEACAGVRARQIAESAVALSKELVEAGHLRSALKALDAVITAAAGHETTLAAQRESVLAEFEKRAEAVDLPDAHAIGEWLYGGADPSDVVVKMPVDIDHEPEALIAAAAARAADGKSLFVAAIDPQAGDDWSRISRVEGMSAESLCRALERHGDVRELALVGNAPGRPKFLGAQTRRGPASSGEPDVTFWCPVFAEPWGPWRVLTDGTGGSEEAVVYLARELADRGLKVDVYAPLDAAKHRGLHIEGGVRWRPLDAFDATKRRPGVLIACRAPWVVRMPGFVPERTYVWHQDAVYQSGWSAPIARAVKHLWVSRWQRDVLLEPLGVRLPLSERQKPFDALGAVIGNGIPRSALDVKETTRDPLSVVYLSSPVRGLNYLLDAWPTVHASFPDATLRVYYGWYTLPQQTARLQQQMNARMRSSTGILNVGRLPQRELEEDLVRHSVWAYPTAFAEGFCIAGVRAAAAGLLPVYRQVAAMSEIQYPSSWAVPEVDWVQGGGTQFLEALLAALQAAKSDPSTTKLRVEMRKWAEKWTWDRCANALLAQFARDGQPCVPATVRAAEGA